MKFEEKKNFSFSFQCSFAYFAFVVFKRTKEDEEKKAMKIIIKAMKIFPFYSVSQLFEVKLSPRNINNSSRNTNKKEFFDMREARK